MIKVLQIGFGPLGILVTKYIAKKYKIKTVAVVDKKNSLKGKSLHELSNELPAEKFVYNSVEDALNTLSLKPDVAIITTVSSLEKLIPQIKEVAKFGIPIKSTFNMFLNCQFLMNLPFEVAR